MEFRQMYTDLFFIFDTLHRVPIVHSIHDFFDIGVCLVPEVTLKLLASHSWSKVHDRLRGLPLVDFWGRRLIHWITHQGIGHTFLLVRLVTETISARSCVSKRLWHGRILIELRIRVIRSSSKSLLHRKGALCNRHTILLDCFAIRIEILKSRASSTLNTFHSI